MSIYVAVRQNNFFDVLACARFNYILYAIYGDKLCKKTTRVYGDPGSAPPPRPAVARPPLCEGNLSPPCLFCLQIYNKARCFLSPFRSLRSLFPLYKRGTRYWDIPLYKRGQDYGVSLYKRGTRCGGVRGQCSTPLPPFLKGGGAAHRRDGGLGVATFYNCASLAKGRTGGRIFMSPPRWDI